jgi:glutamyl-tRNA synthetase
MNLENEIRAYALRNSIEYGTTSADKILPKLFQHGLEKKEIGKIMPEIVKIVKSINALSDKHKHEEFERYKKYLIEKTEKEHRLSELPNISKKMVFRLAPYPSGAIHIGNAKTYLLNALYAEKYNAKILFMMDDTIGSEEKQVMPESYTLIPAAFDWLNVKYEKPILCKSDRLDIYYKYALELIKKDKAYICFCAQEKLRDNRANGKDCECRSASVEENIENWDKMFDAKPGACILRLKTSMQHPNPAFRDRVLFRISDREHPKVGKKFRVWPTLEMTWAIDDHLLGITHILRGNDLMIETDMEKYIWDIFGWKHPETMHAGLIKIEGIEGAKLSKSKAQKEVKSGAFTGWDDPRTWSIQSLKRRGFRPDAIRDFIKEIGLNKQDITVPIDALYAINRKLIDPESMRFSFVESPVELDVKEALEINEVEVQIHPDKPAHKRIVPISPGKLFISKKDFDSLKGQEIRLLHLYNIKLGKTATKLKGKSVANEKAKAIFTSEENKPIHKINWVSNPVKTRILMVDGTWVEGFAEEAISTLNPGDVIQFERNFFCRFDKLNGDVYEFWFTHR